MRRIATSTLLALALTSAATPVLAQGAHEGAKAEPEKTESASKMWEELKEGNERYVSGKEKRADHVTQRKQLAKTQHPHVAVLSCSDSRVPPEIVFDQGVGDLFVVRDAGNTADPIAIGSLEYAVEHLGTSMIVVLGHQSCGAVTAACSGDKMPSSNLEAVVNPVAQSCKLAKEKAEKASLVDFAIRDHVHMSAQGLLEKSPILKHAHEEGKLTIVEAYYSLETGEVAKLR